jgi:hypothetical protein
MRNSAELTISWIPVVLTAAFGIAFSAELYLFAATASIDDMFQPGISAVRMRFHPLALMLLFGGGPLLLGLFWRKHRSALSRFCGSISLLGGVICVFALVSILILENIGLRCDEQLPAVRELGTTLRHALYCPAFSGRSVGVAVYGVFLSAFLYWGSRRLR